MRDQGQSRRILGVVCSLDNNMLGGYYDDDIKFVSDMSGIIELAATLPKSHLTSLRWTAQPIEL